MAYQNNGYNPVLDQQMYGDARGRETVPQGQGQPMPPLQHMHHQQFYPSPYAHIKPQQSQAQAQVQIQAQAQDHPHPQIQAHSHQYGGGGGSMAPPPNMAAMSAGMMPAAMSHQQMHMRNTSNQQTPPRTQPDPISATPPTSRQFQKPPTPSPPIQKPLYPSPATSQALQPSMPMPAPTPQNLSASQAPSQLMQQPSKQILQPPLSPTSAHRETQRVTALLEINRALLQEVVLLQNAGKAGVPPQPPPSTVTTGQNTDIKDASTQSQPQAAKQPCREYIECMRRLQANLAFLVLIADRSHKPPSAIPPTPVIMEAPPAPSTGTSNWSADGLQTLERMYKNLKELYPEWKGGGGVVEKAG